MKRILTIATLGSMLFLASTGILLARGNQIRPNPTVTGATPGQSAEMAPCHDAAMGTDAIPAEAPWISLALANAGSLGLSGEQVRNLTELRTGYQAKASDLSREVVKAEEQIAAELAKEPADLTGVKALVERAATLRSDLRLSRIDTLRKGRAVLTVGQRGKLEDLASRTMHMYGASVDFDSLDEASRESMM